MIASKDLIALKKETMSNFLVKTFNKGEYILEGGFSMNYIYAVQGDKPFLIAQKISHKWFHVWKCYLECKKWQIKDIHSKCYRLHLHSNELSGFYSFLPYQIRLLHLKGSWSLPETIWARGDICLDRRDRQSQKITKFTFYWEISTLILPNFKQWCCKCRLLLCFFCTNRQIYT